MVKTEKGNLAAKVPMFMLAAGAIICAVLVIKSLLLGGGAFDYHKHVLSVQLYQAIMFICIECGLAAVWFEILRIKTDKNGG